MFLFPYGTDAPVYYWPFVTVAIIVVNVLVFGATVANPEMAQSLVLTYGDGLHPTQWITSNFVHAHPMHLIGNMLGLWVFALIVEGKLGWYKTLAVYLGIGVLQCVVEQCMMLGASHGCSCGASAVIFGLMAMSLIWAPENHIQCIFCGAFGFRWFYEDFEIKVTLMVGLELLLQIVTIVLTQGKMGSAVLHVMGAAAGFLVAIGMLKLDLVDCENWDFFSVIAGRHKMSPEERELADARREKQAEAAPLSHQAMLAEIRRTIQEGRPLLALRAHERFSRELADWTLPQPELWNLIQSLHEKKHWVESIPAMNEYLSQYPQNAALVRLKLAQILAVEQRDPRRALEVLSHLDEASLDAKHRAFCQKIRTHAGQLQRQNS
jgi:membrane associated rhomboid family serine protease